MIPLLCLSVLALGVILDRALALRPSKVVPKKLERVVLSLRPGDSLAPLTHRVQDRESPLARIVAVFLQHRNRPCSENREIVQTQARHEIAHLEKGLVLLEITTGVSPLFGLLGTLSGLIHIFATVGTHQSDPVALAQGIAEALNTTLMGLAVAVPSLIGHSYFERKIEMLAIDMEALTTELLAVSYP